MPNCIYHHSLGNVYNQQKNNNPTYNSAMFLGYKDLLFEKGQLLRVSAIEPQSYLQLQNLLRIVLLTIRRTSGNEANIIECS